MLNKVKKCLKTVATKERAIASAGYFKTGKGQYGEGDVFLGVTVPELRRIANMYSMLTPSDIKKLLYSPIHEERLLALLILVQKYQKGDKATQEKVFEFYMKNLRRVNNWDLVDLSAPNILGAHLFTAPKMMRKLLIKLSKSKNMWERRSAILATFYFIKQGEFTPSLALAKRLMNDKQDLIHKALGWMLREIGKRNISILENFLQKSLRPGRESADSKKMPRTMLRYSIERFAEAKRKKYLLGSV